MSARKFARWIQLVARWECPPDARFTLVIDVTARECIANLEYEGAKAQVQVEAGTPARQVHRDIDEFLGLLALATYRRERARARQRQAAYVARPIPN